MLLSIAFIFSVSVANSILISNAAKTGDLNNPVSIGQNFYSIYANRAYTCTVEMMGCMNIMPLMYFQLNNISMFRGMYQIINVKHSIKAGDITTTFTGVRVSKYLVPPVSNYIISQSLLKILDNSVTKSGSVNVAGNSEKEKIWNEIIGSTNLDQKNVTKDQVESQLLVDIEVPVSNAIYEAVYTDITPQELLSKLMNRKLKEEERYV